MAQSPLPGVLAWISATELLTGLGDLSRRMFREAEALARALMLSVVVNLLTGHAGAGMSQALVDVARCRTRHAFYPRREDRVAYCVLGGVGLEGSLGRRAARCHGLRVEGRDCVRGGGDPARLVLEKG